MAAFGTYAGRPQKLTVPLFVRWWPVLPFLAYWGGSFLLYHIGPFIKPVLSFETYVYLMSAMGLFTFSYWWANSSPVDETKSGRLWMIDAARSKEVLIVSSYLSLVGVIGLIIDRYASGAGSLELALLETEFVRAEYSKKTSLFTTLCVMPQSFYLVSLAVYFYSLERRLRISIKVHVAIVATQLLMLLNSVLTTSRGYFFWLATYIMFYLVFNLRMPLRQLVSVRQHVIFKALFLLFCSLACVYFFWISRNRSSASYLRALGTISQHEQRYNVGTLLTFEDVGAMYQLYNYSTHEYAYIDAFVRHGEWFAFRPSAFFGGRVAAQVTRFYPLYSPKARTVGIEWLENEGLSRFGWPSVFGWPIPMFGICGSLLFFAMLGGLAGFVTYRYLTEQNLGFLILTFCMFASLNQSFDWILVDFATYAAIITGLLYAATGYRGCRIKVPVARHGCLTKRA